MRDFPDDIEQSVRHATEHISESVTESISAAMDDLHEAMKDLGIPGHFDPDDEVDDDEGQVLLGDRVEQRIEVTEPCSLYVKNVSGQVSVRVGESGVVVVRASKHGSERRRNNTSILVDHAGNEVRVRTQGGGRGTWIMGKSVCSVDYDIEVPLGTVVSVKTVSADARVAGTSGPATIETVSGDALLETLEGDLSFTSVSGDIRVRALSGTLAGRTTSGDVRVEHSELSRFNLNTVSGDLVLDTPLSRDGHYLAKTVSGDLLLRVPSDTGATVQLKTTSGDVHCDLPVDIIRAGRRFWQGRINGGGAAVEMSSVSGDLRITRSGSSSRAASASLGTNFVRPVQPPEPPRPPTPPAPPAAEPSDRGTSTILRDLESGEITVEEALARLEALR
jgi:hypothetical protein